MHKFQIEMINELLDMTDRWDASRPAFKVVKVKLGSDFFCYNDNADKPIFSKNSLSYDKHELAKIISYQQLELLFRPFKNHPSFKDFVRWWWRFIAFGVLFILLTIVMLIIFDPKASKRNEYIHLGFVCVFAVILFVIMFHVQSKMTKAVTSLFEYSQGLNQQVDFSIKIIRTNTEKINGQLVEVEVQENQNYKIGCSTYISIESKKIFQDNRYIKLYNNMNSSPFKYICDSKDKPIYQDHQFKFESRKLNRFILFEDLEILLRPFKANYFYQRRIFWIKFALVSVFFILLVIIPLLFLRKDPNLSLLISLSYTVFVYFWFVFCVCKSAKMKALMLHQFKEYCHKISLTNPSIDIILHLKDTKDKKSCIHLLTSLYCLQIRLKEHQQDIIT